MADKKIKNTIRIENENMLNDKQLEQISGGNVTDILAAVDEEIDRLSHTNSEISLDDLTQSANARMRQCMTLNITKR